MTPELTAALSGLALIALGLLGTFLKAWGDKVLAELKVNTAKTNAAKLAAEEAAEQMNWRQQATSLSLENDDLRRRIALLEGLPDCLNCRQKITAVLHASPVLRRRSDLASSKDGPQ